MKKNAVVFLVVAAVMCFVRPAGAAFTNLLQDPGFEAYIPNPYWAQTSTNFGTTLCTGGDCGNGAGTAGPRSGAVWSWFGGTAAYEAGSLSQTVTIPIGAAKLEFYLWVGSSVGDTADIFTAEIDNATLFTADATQHSLYPAYTLVSLDVSAYADNASHTVVFSSVTSGEIVNINLDDTALLSEPSVRLNIAKAGTGSGAVISTDGKINCGSDCTELYLQGTEVKLTAEAALGSTFTGWSGGECSGMDNCTLIMTDNMTDNGTVTANFALSAGTTTTTVSPTTTTTIAASCIDNDGDGYGEGCAAGDDCNDDDAFYNEVCPNCEVKIIPGVLGWFLGEKEKTRILLVIGKRGTELDDTTPMRWESGDIAVLSQRMFFKRFMFIKVSIDGAALDKGAYRALIGTCSATLTLAR
jgi:hypothetical protein